MRYDTDDEEVEDGEDGEEVGGSEPTLLAMCMEYIRNSNLRLEADVSMNHSLGVVAGVRKRLLHRVCKAVDSVRKQEGPLAGNRGGKRGFELQRQVLSHLFGNGGRSWPQKQPGRCAASWEEDDGFYNLKPEYMQDSALHLAGGRGGQATAHTATSATHNAAAPNHSTPGSTSKVKAANGGAANGAKKAKGKAPKRELEQASSGGASRSVPSPKTKKLRGPSKSPLKAKAAGKGPVHAAHQHHGHAAGMYRMHSGNGNGNGIGGGLVGGYGVGGYADTGGLSLIGESNLVAEHDDSSGALLSGTGFVGLTGGVGANLIGSERVHSLSTNGKGLLDGDISPSDGVCESSSHPHAGYSDPAALGLGNAKDFMGGPMDELSSIYAAVRADSPPPLHAWGTADESSCLLDDL